MDKEASGGCVKFRLDRKGDSGAKTLAAIMRPREGKIEAEDGELKDDEDVYDTHVHLRRALDEIASPDTRDRMDNSHVFFEMTLQKMLRLLRLLSYSEPSSPQFDHNDVESSKSAKAAPATTEAAEHVPQHATKVQEEHDDAVSVAQETSSTLCIEPLQLNTCTTFKESVFAANCFYRLRSFFVANGTHNFTTSAD